MKASNSTTMDMLNQDLEGEHAAIIQYLVHAYGMGEGTIACEIEAVAREEMRHMDWLAEAIVKLGGKPSLERGKMRLGNGAVTTWVHNDMLQEEDAILMYRDHIAAVADPGVKRLLQRILSDEEAHHGIFFGLVEKAARDKVQVKLGTRTGPTINALQWGFRHEYTAVLQYLLHAYYAPEGEVKEQLHDQAINEMQHMGWLAEAVVERKGRPRPEHGPVDASDDMCGALRADVDLERTVVAEYGRHIERARGRKVKALLTRIRDHEVYHDQVFGDLLKGLEKER